MNKLILTGVLIVGIFGFQTMVKAADEMAVSKSVEVGNKKCPISHEEIGTGGMTPHKVTYKGKVYNLCCSMCENEFNKDPEKYAKMMDEEAASDQQAVVYTCPMHPEVRQATPGNCPKCGMKLQQMK